MSIRTFAIAACAAACIGWTAPAHALDRSERAMIASIDKRTGDAEQLLETLVNVNSGTMNLPGVEHVGQMMIAELDALGFETQWIPLPETARAGHVVATHRSKNGKGRKMLLIGHIDTVFEPDSPFQTYRRIDETTAEGPGVNDMKGGLVVMLEALRAMKAAGVLKNADITIVLTGDEERTGAPREIARADLVKAAEWADVALEFEGLARVNGVDHGSISRRGGTGWTLEVTARSGHSSRIFSEDLGYGAVYEVARILNRFREELPEPYLTYNVGVLVAGATAELNTTDTGGSATGKTNIIPEKALARGDFRTLSLEQAENVKRKMQAIVDDHLPGTDATITFGRSGAVMPPTEGSRALLASLNVINKEMGLPAMPELDPMLRGGGDISEVSGLLEGGLIGMGPAGAGAHAAGETVDLASMPLQAKRAALMMYRLSRK
ncbi:MAG: M20/M25/M40 family metallo-hydrolase [Hyphomonadaceae bacterium]